ncbi:MAG: T9SS type A sorting domain-containing protein [Prolixibacteraceae bacterium]|nr:T9SS type A sorting domain-containing protein [Prolixibacteraceae bacterium]
MKTLLNDLQKNSFVLIKTTATLFLIALVLMIPNTVNSNTLSTKSPLSTPSTTTYWDVIATLDFGGTFQVTADATLITSGSVFTIHLTTKEIAGTEEVHNITFEGTHDNGVYTISNNSFNPFDDETEVTLHNAVFTVDGDNLTGEGSFSETIPGIGEINGTLTATGTKTGEEPFLTVSPANLSLPAASGSTGTFEVSANVSWSVITIDRWISAFPSSGNNNGSVLVAVSANSFPSERSATILVTGEGVSTKIVTVTQAANGDLTFQYPVPRYGHSASKICKFVYLLGGRNYHGMLKSASLNNDPNAHLSKALYRYDTITHAIHKLTPGTMTESEPLPGIMGHNAIVFSGELYVLNGIRSDTNNLSTYVYDPITYSWEEDFIPIPYASKSHAFASLENPRSTAWVVFGGQKGESLATDSCHRFENMTGVWSSLSTMPLPAVHSGASIVTNNKFYCVGGMTNDGPSGQISAYNQIDRTWSMLETELPAAMYGMSFASIKNKLYLYGGAGSSDLKSMNAYNPEQFSTTLYQVTIDTLSGDININERANGLPPLLYSAGWTEENEGDTLFYTFGGINAIFPDGDTLLTNNFYRFNMTDSLVQQYDTVTQDWGELHPEVFVSDDTLNFEALQTSENALYIASNTTWNISSGQPWLDSDVETASGNQLVLLSVEENTSLEERETVLQISCNEESMHNIVVIQAGATPTLSASVSSLNIGAETNSTADFEISSNTEWEIECDQAWLTVDPLTGTGNNTITLTAEENIDLTEREAILTITANNTEPQTVTVTQAGAEPFLVISNFEIITSANASTDESFDVNSNTTWQISVNETWLSVSEVDGTGNLTISLIIEENTSIFERLATINISGTDIPAQSITVTQEGAPATLSVSEPQLELDAENGSEATFDVTSNTTWSAASDQTWLTVNPETGTGNATVTLVAEENSTGSERQANITVIAEGTEAQTIEVLQAPLTGFTQQHLNGIRVSPNPFYDGITVNPNQKNIQLSLYDLNGRLMLTQEISEKKHIKTEALPEGVYILELISPKEIFKMKIIKKHSN